MRKDVEQLAGAYAVGPPRSGTTPGGVSWPNAPDLATRYEVLLGGVDRAAYSAQRRVRLLDLGCGTGLLLDWLHCNGWAESVDYTGIDIAEINLRHARERWPEHHFELRDVRERPFAAGTFDYCVACGVFISRWPLGHDEMKRLAEDTLAAVWPAVDTGLSFNTMSKHVDWERDALFYWPLDELVAFCKASLSRHVALRLDYGPWEASALVTRAPLPVVGRVPATWEPRA